MQYIKEPRDTEAEHALLSSILTEPERFVQVMDKLKPRDFYGMYEQSIWAAMLEVFKAGQEIDLITLKNQLQKQEVDAKPAMDVLTQAWSSKTYMTNLMMYVEAIKNKSLLRQVIHATQAQGYNATLDDASAPEILQDLEKNILEINEQITEAHAVDASGILSDIQRDVETAKKRGWVGFKTGFMSLDKCTGGIIPTQAWIIGAYTGIGKTFFILQLLLNILRDGGRVVLFSTEMDRKMNMLRLLGNISGLSTLTIMQGRLLEPEELALKSAYEELQSYGDRLIIYDDVYTISEIRLKAKKLKITKGLDVIGIDFIQNLRGKESIYERMAEAALGLQALAQELEITALIGSQVSQSAAGWQSKEAIEFKGAGEIAAIADVAIWLAKTDDPRVRKVILRKVRHGKPGFFEVQMKFPAGTVVEIDEASEKEVETGDVQDQLMT